MADALEYSPAAQGMGAVGGLLGQRKPAAQATHESRATDACVPAPQAEHAVTVPPALK